MVSITADPKNPDQIAVTASVTIFIDKILVHTLSAELATAIREAAIEDLKTNQVVRQLVAKAAVAKLLATVESWEEKK
jgi:uncharacterized membrane protein